MTLASSIYEEAEYRESAIDIVKDITAQGRKVPNQTDSQSAQH